MLYIHITLALLLRSCQWSFRFLKNLKKKMTDSSSSNDDYNVDEEILYSDDDEVSDSTV